jgi:MFS family permease
MAATTTAPLARDVRLISVISVAHGSSHFFQLVLPPLFPFLKDEFDVSYAALGALMGTFYVVSGLAQFASGFAVDRYGARRILIAGTALLSAGVLLAGLVPAFWALFPLAAMMGLGNSVFHPADFAILNGTISTRRLGHAYSTHAICGNLGWAIAPVLSFALGSAYGWRTSLVVLGLVGIGVLAMLWLNRGMLTGEHRHEAAPSAGRDRRARYGVFLQAPVLFCFAYFVLLSMALVGVQTFGPTALNLMHGISLGTATTAVAGYMLGGAGGVLLGGFIATWTPRHDRVAATGMLTASLLMACMLMPLAQWLIIPLLTVVGFVVGITNPSRDLIVRAATPRGAAGRVYGFVYSGLDLGALIAPFVLGAMLDRRDASSVFVFITVTLALTIFTVLQVRRSITARSPAVQG